MKKAILKYFEWIIFTSLQIVLLAVGPFFLYTAYHAIIVEKCGIEIFLSGIANYVCIKEGFWSVWKPSEIKQYFSVLKKNIP
jgi:hypothetical protein